MSSSPGMNPIWTRLVFAACDERGHVVEEDSPFNDAEFDVVTVPDVGDSIRIGNSDGNETRWVVRRRWGFNHFAPDATDITVVCLYVCKTAPRRLRSAVSLEGSAEPRPPH